MLEVTIKTPITGVIALQELNSVGQGRTADETEDEKASKVRFCFKLVC